MRQKGLIGKERIYETTPTTNRTSRELCREGSDSTERTVKGRLRREGEREKR